MQTIPLLDGSFSRLASKSKSFFKSLKEKSNCYFYLDFNKHHLHVYGNQQELETTKVDSLRFVNRVEIVGCVLALVRDNGEKNYS